MIMENQETQNVEKMELTIKFSRKLARPFTGKNGVEMVAISIPNENPEDKRSWEEFVLPAERVHDDYYGSKSLWAKIPEDGNTTLTRSVKPAEEGGNWSKEERQVDNHNGSLLLFGDDIQLTGHFVVVAPQPVQTLYHQCIAVAKAFHHLRVGRAVKVLTALLVHKDTLLRNPEIRQCYPLPVIPLSDSRYADVAIDRAFRVLFHKQFLHSKLC